MPRMDDGPTDGPPGRNLKTVWVTLTEEEAQDLLESLKDREAQVSDGSIRPGWHTHVTDDDGNELTLAVGESEVTDNPQSDQPG
jgi:hypothetical protein